VLTNNIQDNQDGVEAPGEGGVPTSEREEEVSTWTKVQAPLSRRQRQGIRPLRGLNPFLMLPDELVLMIIKRAADLDDTGHAIIVDVISNISARFNRLAKDKSLWQGRVNIKIGQAYDSSREKKQKLKKVIQSFLGAGIKSLYLISDKFDKPKLTAEDMIAMAVKCPNLKMLHIRGFKMETLPALENPWNLEHISFEDMDINPGAFNDTEIHVSLPKLRVFEMRYMCYDHPGYYTYDAFHMCYYDPEYNRQEVPDMRKCKELEEVCIFGFNPSCPNARSIYKFAYHIKRNSHIKIYKFDNYSRYSEEEATPYERYNFLPAGMSTQRITTYCGYWGDCSTCCDDYEDDMQYFTMLHEQWKWERENGPWSHDDVYDAEFYRTRHITREMLLNL